MTLPATTRRAGPFNGNGVTTAFPFTFKVFATSDLKVVKAVSGVESTLVLNSDYTVTLNGDQDANPGGTVTYASLASGQTLSIAGALVYDQPLDLPSGGNFSPIALENELDRLTMQVQQVAETAGRALTVPITSTASSALPAPEANKIIAWNETASALENLSANELATVVAYGTAASNIFTGTGAQTAFVLTYNPGALNNLDISIGGVTQLPGIDYTWSSGTTVTFTSAPPLGAKVLIRYMQALSLGTADAGSVQYLPAGVSAAPTTVQSKLRESVSVKDFGAVGNGVADDTTAVQAAITYAFSLGKPVTVNMDGCNCLISSPIIYPAGGNVKLRGGKITASGAFSTSRYLVEVTSQSAGLCNYDLRFDDIVLDANHRGGCLRIDNYIRVVIGPNFKAFHFSTDGIRLDQTLDSHECTVDGAWCFEYLYGESGYLTPTATSCGIRINSFDNIINNYVSYYTGNGLIVNAQYNKIGRAHIGGSTYAAQVTGNAAFSSFVQCYIDSAAVQMQNPWNTEFIGCKFLHNTANTAFSFVVLKPLSAGVAINGLKITECSFHNINAAVVNAVTVDTSSGSISAALVSNCYIQQNSFVNCAYAYTRFMTQLYQTAATTYTFNLGPYLPFGNIQMAKHSFYDASNVKPASNISSISGNQIVVTNSIAGNGTVFIEVDVNTGTI